MDADSHWEGPIFDCATFGTGTAHWIWHPNCDDWGDEHLCGGNQIDLDLCFNVDTKVLWYDPHFGYQYTLTNECK